MSIDEVEFRAAYDAALEWAEKQELWVAEKLPNEQIAAAFSGNIVHHFRRFLHESQRLRVVDTLDEAIKR